MSSPISLSARKAQTLKVNPGSSEGCSQRPELRIPIDLSLTAAIRPPTPLSRLPFLTSTYLQSSSGAAEMLSKFAPRAFAAPVRYAPVRPAFSPAVVRRSVTTDAASSHAERSDVPSVRSCNIQEAIDTHSFTDNPPGR